MTDPLDIDCGSPEFNHPGELPGRLTAHRRNEDNTVPRVCTTRSCGGRFIRTRPDSVESGSMSTSSFVSGEQERHPVQERVMMASTH